jgi:D-sedoheptulose 7-phosphate isomerase
MDKYINTQIDEVIDNLAELKNSVGTIQQIANICIEAIQNGHKIIFCGNGGSAAQSQHLAAELVGRYKLERPAINALSLTVDTSNLTAIGNDYGYDKVFSRQLEGIGQTGDILFGLSTSGNSQNIVSAFETAQEKEIMTIALVGKKGGRMKEIADFALSVPAETSAHVQELHIATGHIICDLIEKNFILFPKIGI